MFAIERQRRLLGFVNEQGSIRIALVSQALNVTSETIRRDLDTLASEGKLLRSHGGAVRLDEVQGDTPFQQRQEAHSAEKTSVSETALQCIQAGETIALDASSTAWYLARRLPDMPLTVLTNSLQVVLELSNRERIDVISTGGILRSTSMSFIGPLADDAVKQYHVNKAFLSCEGLHPVYGVSDSNELQAMIKRRMASIADEVYVIADHTKFGTRAFAHVVGVDKVDVIISDSIVDDALVASFRSRGVQVRCGDGRHESSGKRVVRV